MITWEIDEDVPEDPHIKVPEQMNDASLGTRMDKVNDLKSKFTARTGSIRGDVEKLRKAQEARGEGNLYKEMQPFVRPELEELVEERIDVLYPSVVSIEDGNQKTVTMWCQ